MFGKHVRLTSDCRRELRSGKVERPNLYQHIPLLATPPIRVSCKQPQYIVVYNKIICVSTIIFRASRDQTDDATFTRDLHSNEESTALIKAASGRGGRRVRNDPRHTQGRQAPLKAPPARDLPRARPRFRSHG